MAGINSWFRSISSVTNSLNRFGKAAVKTQANTARSKFVLLNASIALSTSVVRLGTKVVDYAGSKITGRPRKKRPKAKTNKYAQQKEFRKEDAKAKKRLQEQGIDVNEKPMSFLEEDNNSEHLEMPKFKMTDEEREAMEELALFNKENRGYDSDGTATPINKEDKLQKLYAYLETTEYFREGIEYAEDKKSVIVHLKPLDIQTNDEFFVNFKELILTPTAIMNPDYENYLQMANVNPSKLMTSLLQDYHVERAPMLYFVINYYLKSNTK